MAKALGMKLPWEELLGDCIADFWADDRCGAGQFFWHTLDEYNIRMHKVFIQP
jgi:hypothetical protein